MEGVTIYIFYFTVTTFPNESLLEDRLLWHNYEGVQNAKHVNVVLTHAQDTFQPLRFFCIVSVSK